jgi:hypothetical protein
MKKVFLFWVLAGLIAGLAQAQTPQVRLVWEKTFSPSKYAGLAMDAGDTVTGPTFLGWQDGKLNIVMDRNGNVTAIPLDTTYPHWETHLSRNGKYILNAWFPPGYIRPIPDANLCLNKPAKVEVRDQAGRVVFERRDFWGELISDNGTILARSRDSLMFFGLDGNLKGKAVFAPERVIICSPAFVSDDGSRALVYAVTRSQPMMGIVVAVDSSGKKVFEVPHPEVNYALRSDGASLFSLQPQRTVKTKKVMYYNREGELLATWILQGMGPSNNVNPIAFSEDGNYAVVSSYQELALLQLSPPTIVWMYKNPLKFNLRKCLVSSQGRYVVSRSAPSKVVLFDREGKVVWNLEFPAMISDIRLNRDYLLVVQGSKASLFKVTVP